MRVLIVEDDAAIRTFLERVMAALMPGAEVIVAANGYEGLQYALAEPIDLVVSDHRMPEMSGLEMLIALRQHSAIPFIMISADADIERPALYAGASAYLIKPVEIDALRDVINNVLATPFNYTRAYGQ